MEKVERCAYHNRHPLTDRHQKCLLDTLLKSFTGVELDIFRISSLDEWPLLNLLVVPALT